VHNNLLRFSPHGHLSYVYGVMNGEILDYLHCYKKNTQGQGVFRGRYARVSKGDIKKDL
jgi:hypothetical protein